LLSGVVSEKNEAVEAAPALINTSAMTDGWLFKVKLTKPEELEELMDQSAYDKYLREHEETE
jgi:glycine cleavage system H protein